MTKLCIHCNGERKCNDSDHVIQFDDNFRLPLRKSFFKTPDGTGRTFTVKFLMFQNRTGEKKKAVVKWSRHRHIRPCKRFFKCAKKRCNRMSRVIAAFKNSFGTRGWKFVVVLPTVLHSSNGFISVEPYIENLTRFEQYVISDDNCNADVVKLLNALCHFSYKFSNGKYVIQNLKIAVDEGHRSVLMLPPALVSGRKGTYGLEDSGTLSDTFRSEHGCNEICQGMPCPE